MYPDAIHIGPFSINAYGALMAVAFLVGLWTASRRAPIGGISPERVFDVGPWLIIGAIIGARALYVITFWREQFAGHNFLDAFKVWQGGLVYYGGLIGASLGCILFATLKKVSLWKLADTLAPSVALGQAFGRIGCLFYGCCYGRACGFPWAITYPEGHETHPLHGAGTPVHPTPVYESLLAFALYLFLAWRYRKKAFDGQVFALYLVGYGLVRSFVELFRGDYPPQQLFLHGLATPAHIVSLISLAVGIALVLFLRRQRAEAAPS